MIDLYTWTTPNGWKVSCTLEELELAYRRGKPTSFMRGMKEADNFVYAI